MLINYLSFFKIVRCFFLLLELLMSNRFWTFKRHKLNSTSLFGLRGRNMIG